MLTPFLVVFVAFVTGSIMGYLVKCAILDAEYERGRTPEVEPFPALPPKITAGGNVMKTLAANALLDFQDCHGN